MIACLEKSEGNVDFHEIVDLLTASTIHYALTTIVISELTVRSDLHFNDEYGITCLTNYFSKSSLLPSVEITNFAEPFNDTYETPKHTQKVFANMRRKGKSFSGTVTPLFASITEEQIPVTESSSPQNTQTLRQALQEDTQLSQTSMPIPNVADEAVFKERDDRVVRATTTNASLDAAHASGDRPRCQEAMRGTISQTRFERVPTPSYDSPLLGGNTSRSDEERFEQPKLTDNIPPTPHDSPLLGGYTPGSDE
ncbi:hypothetical protein Tco_1423171, partial [Tanacetum coccineum]